jgi:hypothetical protein
MIRATSHRSKNKPQITNAISKLIVPSIQAQGSINIPRTMLNIKEHTTVPVGQLHPDLFDSLVSIIPLYKKVRMSQNVSVKTNRATL